MRLIFVPVAHEQFNASNQPAKVKKKTVISYIFTKINSNPQIHKTIEQLALPAGMARFDKIMLT